MKYYGQEKCRILKEIRAEIAKANDIEWVVSECKHRGNCKGTCPKCEQEVRQLEAALARREALGKTVAVVGISAAISLSVTGCDNPFQPTAGVPVEQGMMAAPETATTSEKTSEGTHETAPESDALICETDMGEIAVPGEVVEGEMPVETADAETDPDIPMGAPVWIETEPDEETLPPETAEETEWAEELMGEPVPAE